MKLEDKIEIHDLCHRYALYVDAYKVEDWVGLFTADVIFDESEFDFGRHVGQDAVRAYGNVLRDTTKYMSHIMSNHLVEPLSDDAARGTSSGLIEVITNDEARTRYIALYEDEYKKTDSGWKIHRRKLRKTFDPESLAA